VCVCVCVWCVCVCVCVWCVCVCGVCVCGCVCGVYVCVFVCVWFCVWCVYVCVCVCVCVFVCVFVCVCVCVCVVCVCVCVFVCVCVVCMCVCVCVVSLAALRCGFVSRSVREVWLCLCMINTKQTSWDATDTLSWPQYTTCTSHFKPFTPIDRRGPTKCSEVFVTELLCWFPVSFKGSYFWYKFYEHVCYL